MGFPGSKRVCIHTSTSHSIRYDSVTTSATELLLAFAFFAFLELAELDGLTSVRVLAGIGDHCIIVVSVGLTRESSLYG